LAIRLAAKALAEVKKRKEAISRYGNGFRPEICYLADRFRIDRRSVRRIFVC
jgi:hypothetical protein